MQSKLFRRVAIELDDCAILLGLGNAELGPQSDGLFGERLNRCYTAAILLVYARKFGVEPVNVGRGEIKAGGDRLVWGCRR